MAGVPVGGVFALLVLSMYFLYTGVSNETRGGFSSVRIGRIQITAPKLFSGRGYIVLSLGSLSQGCSFPLPKNGIVSNCKAHKNRDNSSVGAYTHSAVHTTFSKIMHVTGPCNTCNGIVIVQRPGKLRAMCDRGIGGLMGDKSIIGTKVTVNLAKHAKQTAARRLRFRAQVGKRRFGPNLVFSVGGKALHASCLRYAGGNGKVIIGTLGDRGILPGCGALSPFLCRLPKVGGPM